MNNQIDAKEIQNSIDEVSDIMETVVAEKCENIVKYFTSDLDAIMDAINNDVKAGITDDNTLEEHFLKLTSVLYDISAKAEFLGLFEDNSMALYKMKFNELYSINSIKVENGKKPTQNDNTIYAETNSINEKLANNIYSRSFRIVKTKVDSANEMVKSLSKIISKRMSENDLQGKAEYISQKRNSIDERMFNE